MCMITRQVMWQKMGQNGPKTATIYLSEAANYLSNNNPSHHYSYAALNEQHHLSLKGARGVKQKPPNSFAVLQRRKKGDFRKGSPFFRGRGFGDRLGE